MYFIVLIMRAAVQFSQWQDLLLVYHNHHFLQMSLVTHSGGQEVPFNLPINLFDLIVLACIIFIKWLECVSGVQWVVDTCAHAIDNSNNVLHTPVIPHSLPSRDLPCDKLSD